MKKGTMMKVLALGLVLVMALTLFAGCGKEKVTSDPVAESEDDGFADASDYVYDGDGINTSGSSRPSGSNGQTSGSQSYVSYDNSHVQMTDNEKIFESIPTKLKGKTVKFADWGEALADRYQKLIKQFEKETGIKVNTIQYDESTFISKVAQAIAAGQSPDIAASNNTFPQALEVVQPLPKPFDPYDGFWDERVSEATQVGNKQYFVNTRNSPFTGGYVVYYNKKIFNSNGLTTPDDYYKKGDWTYENMYKCIEEVSKYADQAAILESITIAGQAGTGFINYDSKTGTFTGTTQNETIVDSVKYMAKAAQAGYAGGYGIQSFGSGKVGLCMAGTYGTKYNGYFKDMKASDIGVVPLPTSYNGKKLEYMPLGYRGYGICKGVTDSDRIECAYYFLRYFLDMDKYDKNTAKGRAGIDIFANKVLEKYFRETQLVLFQNSKLYFEMFNGPLALVGTSWGSNENFGAARRAAPDQVAVELNKSDNIVKNAAEEATKRVANFTK